MNNKILQKAETYRKTHTKKQWLYRGLSILAAGAVFCTTYALILPAITLEKDPVCGLTEHEHTPECYAELSEDREFSCLSDLHEHGENCFDLEGNILCGYADYVVHIHDEFCFDENSELICELFEIEEHVHDETCFFVPEETEPHKHTEGCFSYQKGDLICELEESDGHIHEESCNGIVSETLLCTIEESEGHIHDETCEGVVSETMICEQTETEPHEHSDGCYAIVVTDSLICEEEESEGHTHDESCFEESGEQICELEETEGHLHSEECYEQTQQLVCELSGEGHTHDESCCEIVTGNICSMEESEGHNHGEFCYEIVTDNICGMEETEGHVHNDDCYEWIEILICEEGSDVERNEEESAPEPLCELEEIVLHEHDEECFDADEVLICGQIQVLEHIHTEECFADDEPELLCGLEEHTHDDILCYTDTEADVESEEDWEATLPADLTGNWAEDLIAVAESQLGYTESEANVLVGANGEISHYSRYGAWGGEPYAEWNTLFTSFCLYYAGIELENVSAKNAEAEDWQMAFSEAGLYSPEHGYTPVAGDLVFFERDDELRTAVLTAVDDEQELLFVIEGDVDGTVVKNEYQCDEVSGYGLITIINEPVFEIFSVENYAMYSATATSKSDFGVEVDKYVKANDLGEYMLTLEAYSTGTRESTPVDVIFIVDQSCSMYSPVNQNAAWGTGTVDDTKLTVAQLKALNMSDPKNEKAGLEGYYVAVFQKAITNQYHAIPLRYKNGTWQRTAGDGSIAHQTNNGEVVIWVSETVQEVWNDDWIELTSSWTSTEPFTIYKSVYGAAYDAMEAFADEMEQSGVENCNAAIVGFSCPKENYGAGGPMQTGLFINGEAVHGVNFTNTQLMNAYNDMSSPAGIANFRACMDAVATSGQTTTTDAGFYITNQLIQASKKSSEVEKEYVVILFTDGRPENNITYNSSGNHYKAAIEASNTTKAISNTEVYSFGPAASPGVGLTFLQAVSSAYPNAAWNEGGGNSESSIILGAPDTSGKNYFGQASDSEELQNIFTALAKEIVLSTTTLDDTAVMMDIVSDSFVLQDHEDNDFIGDIGVYTAYYNGSGWDEWVSAKDHLTVSADRVSKRIEVTGFDYSADENIVDMDSGNEGGHKLILQIPIVAPDGYLGGDYIATNTVDSGIYANGNKVVAFPCPHIDLPAKVTLKKVLVGNTDPNISFTFDAEYTIWGSYHNNEADTTPEGDSNHLATVPASENISKTDIPLSHEEIITFENVVVGTDIMITETDIPAGYILKDIVILNSDGLPISEDEITRSGNSITVKAEPGMIITFTNFTGTELPSTGGIGTFPYTLGGLMIVGASGILFMYKSRRKQRD